MFFSKKILQGYLCAGNNQVPLLLEQKQLENVQK